MYHWAADLGGPGAGWLVAWLNIFGLIAAQAGINYSCAQFILPFLGLASKPRNLLLMFAFILITQGALNHWGVKLVAILNDLSVTVHIAGVAILVAGLLFLDASAHMAEETEDPRRQAPWGIVLSVAVSGVVGYLLLIALTLAIRTIPGVLAAKDPEGNAIPAVIAILGSALGAKAGNAMAALASMAMWFCGLSCITSASRALFSLARDEGTPWYRLLRAVNPKHGTPAPAIWSIVLASIAAMVWTKAVPIVTSLSTVALYLAYIIPVWLGLRARRAGSAWPTAAVWSLGRFGPAVNTVAIAFAGFICFVLIMPPNQLAGETLAGLLIALGVLYAAVARRRYRGPKWSHHEVAVRESNL
jgi:amino acid transporter